MYVQIVCVYVYVHSKHKKQRIPQLKRKRDTFIVGVFMALYLLSYDLIFNLLSQDILNVTFK